MRALVIAHGSDHAQVHDVIFKEGRLSAEVFTLDNCSFDYCYYKFADDNRPVLVDQDNRELDPDHIASRYGIVVLIAGHHAANSPDLTDIIATFLNGRNTPDWSNEAVVIIDMADLAHSTLQSLPSDRTFHVPSFVPDTPKRGDSWVHLVKAELAGLIQTIGENQTRNPNVGFGVLLVDDKFRFFLMERLREPGRGRLGTIGGDFERGQNTRSQLARILERRFRPGNVPDMALGPLLACTNMRGEFLHYIDLTYLALTREENKLRNVRDRGLKSPGAEMLSHLSRRGSSRASPRVMFTISEVAIFHRKNLLFTPVANAFESFCRQILAEHLLHGRRRSIHMPSLFDESQTLEIRLPSNVNRIREVVSDMRWSSTTGIYFESEIQ